MRVGGCLSKDVGAISSRVVHRTDKVKIILGCIELS